MDIIYIRSLAIDTVVGIYDWERKIRQKIIFDIEMACDIKKAALSDDIKDTVNYKAVCKRLIGFVEESQFQLVETLIESSADIILKEFDVCWVKITLNKVGALSGAQDVGIIIERGSRS
jgi:7,8-dihydroneopterin aldolase/epimerase/oxygenase